MSTLTFDHHPTWIDYKSRILNLHPNFFKSLASAHPHLKEKETKLCALILEEADTETIALHLDMKARAVREMKLRIKKNMGLNTADDLHAHLVRLC